MKLTHWTGLMMGATVATAMALPVKSEATRYVAHATVTTPAALRVWVDGGDMFPDYSHVTLWLRADRDCYSSLFLVDTAGFIHVLNARDGWLYGGRTYGYRACDLGLDRLDGRGIAYVFAVGSPVPFDYSSYGDGVCGNGFGYRVVGDPFVASREFYMSTLPANSRWDCVGVSFTRFYVRDWVRYPSYLCAGGPAYHVRLGDTCRDCADVYATYRCNAAAPYAAMRPSVRYKSAYAAPRHVVRYDQSQGRDAYAPMAPGQTRRFEPSMAKETRRISAHEMVRVVSTSREITRAPQFQPERRAYAPVVTRSNARGAQPEIVAYRGRGESRDVITSTREKGAHKKVREAE
jgi:hypothetical protein